MSQSKFLSAVETSVNTVVGYVVAVASQFVIFPLFDIHIEFHQNLLMGLYFTAISLARGYVIRRWFNGLKFHSTGDSVNG